MSEGWALRLHGVGNAAAVELVGLFFQFVSADFGFNTFGFNDSRHARLVFFRVF